MAASSSIRTMCVVAAAGALLTMQDFAVAWLGIFGMLIGRLEVFTLLILFVPAFWKG